MSNESGRLDSVCVYCGSSNDADPDFIAAAATLGRLFAEDGLRLIYGGGGVGLMGACARGANDAGGKVLGIIPTFLTNREEAYGAVETVVVQNMHERKMMMYDRAASFVVLPGGIGTLEEIVELLSWRRLDLHAKPIIFYNPRGFWDPFFTLIRHTIDEKLTPAGFDRSWRTVDRIEEVVPALHAMAAEELTRFDLRGPDPAEQTTEII